MQQVKGKVIKLTKKEKNYFVSLDNKMMLSGWLNKMPENLEEGVIVLLTYTVNGQFNNIDSVMVVPEGAESAMNVPVEEVSDTPVVKNALRVGVISAYNPIQFKELLNQFGENSKVEFTQTHVTPLGAENPSVVEYKLLYTAIIWYR